jgi:holo-[acyl-carrier protein] synthase
MAPMIIGTGIDLAEPARLRKACERRGRRLLDRLFTEAEQGDCERALDPWPRYASRFAAKEAFLKALGTGLRDGMSWLDMEVRKDALGKPELHLSGRAAELSAQRGVLRIHLSLSDLPILSTASVVIEGPGS